MLRIHPAVLCLALAAVTASAPLSAQGRSTVTSAMLEATVVARPTADRAAVTAALTSEQAVATAKRLGVGAKELSDRVAALDDATVQQVADSVLVGGASTIVISTTTVIIVLLILILITD